MLLPGQSAPDFILKDQYDITHRLSYYQGSWVILFFYPKDNMPTCVCEVCNIRDNLHDLLQLGVEVFGINMDDRLTHAYFSDRYDLNFPILSDAQGQICEAYGALRGIGPVKMVRRHSFIISPTGYVLRIYPNVKPYQHAKHLIRDLQTLQTQRVPA